ncbi:hypothetical protein PMAYCL1PPCAC_17135, partial [Pristionchus mayeri]
SSPQKVEHRECQKQALFSRVSSRQNPAYGFPIAFAKVVHRDYEFLEEQLSVNYAEQHTFCFALDKKAPLSFRRRIMALSVCLPNVFRMSTTLILPVN